MLQLTEFAGKSTSISGATRYFTLPSESTHSFVPSSIEVGLIMNKSPLLSLIILALPPIFARPKRRNGLLIVHIPGTTSRVIDLSGIPIPLNVAIIDFTVLVELYFDRLHDCGTTIYTRPCWLDNHQIIVQIKTLIHGQAAPQPAKEGFSPEIKCPYLRN